MVCLNTSTMTSSEKWRDLLAQSTPIMTMFVMIGSPASSASVVASNETMLSVTSTVEVDADFSVVGDGDAASVL